MRGGIYFACSGIIRSAVEGGVCGESEAWHMTAEELSAAAKARRKAEVGRMKDMDMLAWLIGQYAAVGINSPGRYPGQPDRVRERASGDDEMRELMKNIARRGRKEDGE